MFDFLGYILEWCLVCSYITAKIPCSSRYALFSTPRCTSPSLAKGAQSGCEDVKERGVLLLLPVQEEAP